MTLEETKAAHAAQIADILKTLRPDLTPGQVRKIQQEAAGTITDWQIAPLSTDMNTMIVQGLIGTQPALTRPIPSAVTAQKYLETKYREDHKTDYLPATVKLTIARDVAAADDDARLAMVEYGAAVELERQPVTEVQKLEGRAPQTDRERDDKWLRDVMGLEPGRLLPSQRRNYLTQRDASSEGKRRDAQTVDAMTLKDQSTMSATERLRLHRAQESLKQRA